MALIYNYPFLSTFAGYPNMGLQANGVSSSGDASPAGIGTSLTISNGCMKSVITEADTPTAGGIRSECYFAVSALGDENWYMWDVLVNEEEWDDQGLCTVAQVHCKDSITAAVNFALVLKDGQFRVYIPNSEPPTTSSVYMLPGYSNCLFNQWNSCCLHAKWINDSTGYMEFYINRQLLYKNWFRGTAYNLDTPYFKFGSYDAFHTVDFGTKTSYFRNLSCYSGNIGYEAALGGSPIPSPLYIG